LIDALEDTCKIRTKVLTHLFGRSSIPKSKSNEKIFVDSLSSCRFYFQRWFYKYIGDYASDKLDNRFKLL